ncbi:hypothetical protein C9374_010371 [Naegleria lovaniensis]|uniref:Sugar phosphate transporter domain-containing protein n=1 Tax=Naegleria lovaniensis TaxID=51637 RepID=A0AA88GG72_NAELO|nr:uncharacterized protein C9374_010371 [Naegleria lovaniensis]KAG2374997.1 hypothetical protein C9374_010371 [Naegleria lovaniensis]
MSDSISNAHSDFDLSPLTTISTNNQQHDQQQSSNSFLSNFISSYHSLLLSIQYTLQYFLASILLTLFIKYTVSYSGLRYPLMFLSLQMFVNCFICGVISWFLIKKRLESVVYSKRNISTHSIHKTIIPNWREIFGHLFNWKTFKTLAPFGVLTGFDFGCSTLSLKYITVSLYTMLKSSIPVFVMIISFIFKLEKVKLILIASIVLISVGIGMTSRGSIHFDIFGFILVIVAVIFAAIRLVFAQYILHHNNTQVLYTRLSSDEVGNENNQQEENSDEEHETEGNTLLLESNNQPLQESNAQESNTPINATIHSEEEQHLEYFYAKDSGEEFRASKIEISSVQVFFYSSPVIGLTVLPFALILEGWRILYDFVNITQTPNTVVVDTNTSIQYLRFMFILKFIGMIIFGSFLGVILNVSEFLLIKQTSSLTLTVVSIFKELLLIMISVMVFGDRIGILGVIGYGITLIGIVIYKFQRLAEMRAGVSSSSDNNDNH